MFTEVIIIKNRRAKKVPFYEPSSSMTMVFDVGPRRISKRLVLVAAIIQQKGGYLLNNNIRKGLLNTPLLFHNCGIMLLAKRVAGLSNKWSLACGSYFSLLA